MAPTSIPIGGSVGQGVGEWIANLLWLGCVVSGLFALCVAMVWVTRGKRVALPTGRHRRAVGNRTRKPMLIQIRKMVESVGVWMMKISRPPAEPSRGGFRRRRLPTLGPMDRRRYEEVRRQPEPEMGHTCVPHEVRVCTDGGRPYPTGPVIDSGAVVATFMDDLLVRNPNSQYWRVVPNHDDEYADMPGLESVHDNALPYGEELGTSARTRLERIWVDLEREAQQ
ncbi:hypothetical protein C8R45DRAFT_1109834 [Mycena sanguinolenta]|nr:hypothetical protein C8R45DRAFT_1109834 [Mycena sanguinolenta]